MKTNSTNAMDYIFYRAYKYYKKRKNIPVFSAICYVSLIQLSLLFLGLIIVDFFIGLQQKIHDMSDPAVTIMTLLIAFIVIYINVLIYKKHKIIRLIKNYNYSILNAKIKTWTVFMICPFIFLSAIVLRLLLNNL